MKEYLFGCCHFITKYNINVMQILTTQLMLQINTIWKINPSLLCALFSVFIIVSFNHQTQCKFIINMHALMI